MTMDEEAAPNQPSGASPPASPTQPHSGYRNVIASSINLVQSYRRSQLFVGDNLPSTFHESSFSSNYFSNAHHHRVHEGDETESLTDGNSYSSFSDQAEEVDQAESEALSEYDEDELPSSFLPPNALGSRRLLPSHHSRRSQTSLRPHWMRLANQEAISTDQQSPRSAFSNAKQLSRTSTTESSQLIMPRAPLSRYGSINQDSPRPLSAARPSLRHRRGSADSTVGSQDPRRLTSYCSSTLSRADGHPIPAIGASTFGQTLFNAFNLLCGVGLLSEPLAFSAMGWIGAIFMFVFCGLSTNYTAKILARLMAEDRSLLTYNDICYKAFGRSMQYPIAGLFCLELFLFSVALIVIFGDSLATIFPGVSANSFKILAFCIVLPTVFMPFRILSFASLLGLFSSLTLVGVVLTDGLVKADAPGSIFHPAKTSLSPSYRWGLSAGLMMSGFSGHSVMPSLAREMKNPQDFNRMVNYAYVAAGLMYLIIGVIGYLMFGDNVSQEITQDILRTPGYPQTINQIAVWMVGINPVAKFALCTRPLNTTIEHLLNLSEIDGEADPHGPPVPKRTAPEPTKSVASNPSHQLSPEPTRSEPRNSYMDPAPAFSDKAKSVVLTKAMGRAISRTIVTFLVVVVSIAIPEFERVMSFLGAFAAFVICTILPVSAEMIATRGQGRSPATKVVNIILLITATVMAGIGTAYAFLPSATA